MTISQYEMASLLRRKLSEGVVEFKFLKADGTIRYAVGTTNMDYVSNKNVPKSMNTQQEESSVVKFYDTEKSAWRSCKVENLIEITIE